MLVLSLRYSNADDIPLQINFTNKFLCYWAESFVYKQKRQQKLLKSRLLFKRIAFFTGKLPQKLNSWNAKFLGYF